MSAATPENNGGLQQRRLSSLPTPVPAPAPSSESSNDNGLYTHHHSFQLDKIEPPKFHPSVCLKQFLYHLFTPLSLPFHIMHEGKVMAINQGFLIHPATSAQPFSLKKFGGLFAQFMFNYVMHMILMGTFFSACVDIYHGRTSVGIIEVSIPTALHVLRFLAVGVKYAYMPKSIYETFHRRLISEEEFNSFMLLSGWINPTPPTMLRELTIAMHRNGVDLHKQTFHLSRGLDRSAYEILQNASKRGVGSDVELRAMGPESRTITAMQFCQILLTDASSKVKGSAKIPTFFGMVYCTMPFLLRAIMANGTTVVSLSELTVRDYYYITFFAFIGLQFFSIFLSFLDIGVADYKRRGLLMEHLGLAVQPAQIKLRTIPSLDISVPTNLANWTTCLRIFQSFGSEYRLRLQLFASGLLTIVIGITISLVVQLAQQGINSVSRIDISLVVILFAIFGGYILTMLLHGFLTNNTLAGLSNILQSHETDLRQQYANLVLGNKASITYSAEAETILSSIGMTNTAIQGVKIEHATRPVAILGAPADANSIRIGVSFLSAIVGIVASYYKMAHASEVTTQ